MGQSYDPLQPSQVRCSCLMDGPSLAIWKLTIPLFQLGPLSPGGPTFSQAFNFKRAFQNSCIVSRPFLVWMNDFSFSRLRALDQLTYSQDAQRQEAARHRKRAMRSRAARPRATRRDRGDRPDRAERVERVERAERDERRDFGGESVLSARRQKPLAPNSTRAFMTSPDAELHEMESLRDQKFALQSEIAATLTELHPLRRRVRELEREKSSIDQSDRYFVQHFGGDSAEVGRVVRQRETEQAILRMQRESADLDRTLERLKGQVSQKTISDLMSELRDGQKAVHQITEQCDLMSQQIDANARRAEAFRMSQAYEEVQANRQRISELKERVRAEMTKHNRLKKQYSAATSANEPVDVDATPAVVDLRGRLREAERRYKESSERLLEQKKEQIEEVKQIKRDREARERDRERARQDEAKKKQAEERERKLQARKVPRESVGGESASPAKKRKEPAKKAEPRESEVMKEDSAVDPNAKRRSVVARGLPSDTTKDRVREGLGGYGDVSVVKVCRDSGSGDDRPCYAYVKFGTHESAERCINAGEYQGHSVGVSWAPKGWRSDARDHKYKYEEPKLSMDLKNVAGEVVQSDEENKEKLSSSSHKSAKSDDEFADSEGSGKEKKEEHLSGPEAEGAKKSSSSSEKEDSLKLDDGFDDDVKSEKASDKEGHKSEEPKLSLPSVADAIVDGMTKESGKEEEANVRSREAVEEEKKDSDDFGLSDPFDKEDAPEKKPSGSSSSSSDQEKEKDKDSNEHKSDEGEKKASASEKKSGSGSEKEDSLKLDDPFDELEKSDKKESDKEPEEKKEDGDAKLELPSIADTLGDAIVGDGSKDEDAEVRSRSAADESKEEAKNESEAEAKKDEEKKESDDLGLSDPFDEKEGSEKKKSSSSSSSSVSAEKGKKEAEDNAQEGLKDKPEGATAAAEDVNQGTPEQPEETAEKDVTAPEETKKDEAKGSDTGKQDAAFSSSSSESGQEAKQDSGYADSFGFDVLEAASGEDEHSTDEETVRIHEEKDAGSPSGVKARDIVDHQPDKGPAEDEPKQEPSPKKPSSSSSSPPSRGEAAKPDEAKEGSDSIDILDSDGF